MQTHNMPKASLLYWSSVYCKGGSKLLLYARLITQIFTKSNYEHVAVCRQCPQKFHGKTVIDNKGIIKLKAGEYYMFEAHKKYGITIETFTKRFEGKFSFSNYWSGKVFIQPLLKRLENDNINYYKDNGNYDDAFEDCLNMLSEKYPIVWAIFSAFDENKFVRWILKKFNIKPQLNKENFCSSFAFINFQVHNSETINKDIAIRTTPEELRRYVFKQGFLDEQKLIEVQDGCLFSLNHEYLNIL